MSAIAFAAGSSGGNDATATDEQTGQTRSLFAGIDQRGTSLGDRRAPVVLTADGPDRKNRSVV